MRGKPCISFLCISFVFFFTSSATQAQAVHAWEGSIKIPTYKLGPADPNPHFPLISKAPVYPYPMLDNLSDDRELVEYRAIYLENQYLKITILPDLGGHVYSIYDKIDQREVLYRNSVIKYGLVGPRGAWIAGGMEFSFPFAHTTDTVSPVASTLRHNADGSATAVVGAVDWVSDMHWEIALTLRPGTARLEEGVTLFNATPVNHLYLFWTNTAVKATGDLQYIYPMRETISDNPFAAPQSWPVSNGVDRSWYKNDPTALAIFARDVHRDFFGVYYHQSNYGVVHDAEFRQDPGKKLWTWGTAGSGKIWDHILSDSDGSYNEIQSGRFDTQGYREFMAPRRVESWTEYWYPVHALDGGFVEATSQMAINVLYLHDDQGRPEVKVLLSPVEEIAGATVVVKSGSDTLRTFHQVHLSPLRTTSYAIVPVNNLDDARKSLNVQVQSAEGRVLLQWSAAAPVDGNPEFVPSVGKALEKEISVTPQTPLDELYLYGVLLQKKSNMQGALHIYDQVLRRDPGYVPALVSEALYFYGAADFSKAESRVVRALERDRKDPSAEYTAGVIYRAEGRLALAKDAFWTSIHYGTTLPSGPSLAPSYVELGEIAIREQGYAAAADLLKRAIDLNPNDAFALTDLAVAERLGGHLQDAALHAEQAVQKMPLLPYALAEQWLDHTVPGTGAGSASWTSTSWARNISSDPQNYIAIASWYDSLGAWVSSEAVLHAAERLPLAQNISPMIDYYLASSAWHEGKSQEAGQYSQRATDSPVIAGVFPNSLVDVTILTEAIEHNPTDARAQFELGNFLFAHARYLEAADLWQEALKEGFNNAVLLRNLGVFAWHVKGDLPAAVQYYLQAIHRSPEDYGLYSDLDEIYEQEGNTRARAQLFQDAPSDVLEQDTVRARRALWLIEQSQYDDALALLVNHHFRPWEGGVAIHTMFVYANIERGKELLATHHPDQAAEAFRQAMQYPESLGTGMPEPPDTAEQLYWLGKALQAQGKNAEAEAAWKSAATQKESAKSASRVYSALAYRQLKQEQTASQMLERYVQAAVEPSAEALDYFTAGIAEDYSNHPDLARRDFQTALQLDPLFWQARMALEKQN